MKRTVLFFLATVLVSGVTALTVVKLTTSKSGLYVFSGNETPVQKVSLSNQLYDNWCRLWSFNGE